MLLVLSDIHIGTRTDLISLVTLLGKLPETPTAVVDLGDVVDHYRIYDEQMTFIYTSQALAAAALYRHIVDEYCDRGAPIYLVLGNHDRRPWNDGLWPRLLEAVRALNLRLELVNGSVVRYGRRTVMAIHGEQLSGRASPYGASPSALFTTLLLVWAAWRRCPEINTVLVGHFHGAPHVRRVGERGRAYVSAEEMLDVVFMPSFQWSHKVVGMARAIALLPPSMDEKPRLITGTQHPLSGSEELAAMLNAELVKHFFMFKKGEKPPTLEETVAEVAELVAA